METLSTDAAVAICRHMNDDHADAVAGYARTYGKVGQVDSATIEAIDAYGMDVAVMTGRERTQVHIAFEHVLKDADDARDTLIAMTKISA